ncbi:MAG: hypothetical protein NXI23_20365 [Bacteroidetes bacterium]|jgi:hypothetical protein|nr:hypothetical protein [Bacteroidota bacterium]MDF1864451.1 hypothetical protein [Saprospiraceae bacterium]
MTMKVQVLKKAFYLVVFIATVSTFTSCNKGYGCPNNFKIEKVAVKAAQAAVKTIVTK